MQNIYYNQYVFLIKNSSEEFIIEELLLNDINSFFIENDIDQKTKVLKIYLKDKFEIIDIICKKYNMDILLSNKIKEMDWLKNWIDSLKPFEFIDKVWINPFPKKCFKKDNCKTINLIPGTAFGTGLHTTTKLAAKLLNEFDLTEKSVIDIGSGTGILSVIAKLNKAKKVVSIDYDIAAVEKTKETFKLNNLESEVYKSDFLNNVNIQLFDFVISNMVYELFVQLLKHKDFFNIIDHNTNIIFSGIICNKKDKFEDLIHKNNLKIIKHYSDGEWLSYLLKKMI